ncbi:MAG: soluble lytic murein transglycosylase [Thermoleophilaceae bacterium]|jgi:soluble lytic murein transglycosylase|nr:soluble lytic murein transglycosylase [Thermoleophilaceae bacterium]
MGTASATSRRRPSAADRRAAKVRKRRLRFLVALLTLAGVVVLIGMHPLKHAVQEITLPLRHEDIIRQQSAKKGLDPALVAAVIYQESKFADRTSPAGARGLMQITPDTARFIAKQSGGIRFTLQDLSTPQINVAYGTWYLRWLMDRYNGRTALALAAYNAGFGHVDEWVKKAGGPDSFDPKADIPFPETRSYVTQILKRRRDYARRYSRELGL